MPEPLRCSISVILPISYWLGDVKPTRDNCRRIIRIAPNPDKGVSPIESGITEVYYTYHYYFNVIYCKVNKINLGMQ